MKKDEFKCAACNGIFKKGWSDKEAEEEAKNLWHPSLLEDTITICDDCFKKGITKFN